MTRNSFFEPLEHRRLMSGTFPNNSVLTIPDLSTVNSLIAVSGQGGTVLDVNVQLNLNHTYDSDLQVFLISPQHTRVQLFANLGGSGDNFSNTTLDDEASTSITTGTAPFPGTFRPQGHLSDFDGQNPNGTWMLEIRDTASLDTGTLWGWSLRIDTSTQSSQQPTQIASGFDYPLPFATPSDTNWLAQGNAYEQGKIHFGSDLAASDGTSVFAIADGTVIGRQPDGFGNEVVFVRHQSNSGPFVAVYGHIRASVANGSTVVVGTKLGVVGDYLLDGVASNNHLHFGIRPGSVKPPSDNIHYGWGRADISWYQQNGPNGFVAPIDYLRNHTPGTSATNSAPAAPMNFRSTWLSPGHINLTWDDRSDNETGFRLQWWNGTQWSTYGTTAANVTSSGTTMSVGYTYYLRVAAFNSVGEAASTYITVVG